MITTITINLEIPDDDHRRQKLLGHCTSHHRRAGEGGAGHYAEDSDDADGVDER